eukprot:gene26080-29460_t
MMTLEAITATVTTRMVMAATALTRGSRPRRAREKITSGMVVEPGPDRKADSTTSSSDRVAVKQAAEGLQLAPGSKARLHLPATRCLLFNSDGQAYARAIEGLSMSKFRFARTSLIVAALGLNFAPALLVTATAAEKAAPAPEAPKPDTVRPELFKLLDPAQIKELMTAKNYAEVQNRITQAEAMANLTPYESFVLNRMKVSLGSVTQNNAMTIQGLEAVLASGKLPAADQGDFIQALGNLYYNGKDYPKAIATFNKYAEVTGDATKLRPYVLRAYYFNNDFATAKAELLKDLEANTKAGKTPALEELQLLANTGAKSKAAPATSTTCRWSKARCTPR